MRPYIPMPPIPIPIPIIPIPIPIMPYMVRESAAAITAAANAQPQKLTEHRPLSGSSAAGKGSGAVSE